MPASRPAVASRRRPSATDRVTVENVLRPGSRQVDGRKYRAMRRAVLAVVPGRAPGVTLEDALAAVTPRLPASLFPDGRGAGWWFKTVQLDLEAKRLLRREKTSPLRIRRA